MKRAWLVWGLVGAVVVTVLIAFNYERGKEAVPLTEVFPGKDVMNNAVEYEFFDSDETASVPVKTTGVAAGSQSPAPSVIAVSKKRPAAPTAPKPVVARAPVAVSTSPAVATTVSVPTSKISVAPSTGTGKAYTIQVAAFKDQSGANKAVELARQKGYTAFVDQHNKSDGSVWYQICIGRFDGQQAAKELLIKVKQDYKDGYIKVLTSH
ncbi:MAG: SPOR domain-containing protein [Candidatus Omnitrophica bacterium]|nr:SPOR domain-containing protein [Candidatus Omnitrophota bacterium]